MIRNTRYCNPVHGCATVLLMPAPRTMMRILQNRKQMLCSKKAKDYSYAMSNILSLYVFTLCFCIC